MDPIELSEKDVRRMIRLIGDVAGSTAGMEARKSHLMAGLAEMVAADDWVWAVSPQSSMKDDPVFTSFTHGGFDPQRLGYLMMAIEHPDLPRLNRRMNEELGARGTHLTRTLEQVDPDGYFRTCEARGLWDGADIGEAMLSFRPLERGMISAVGLYRRRGAEPFSAREARIAHIVLTEVPWLHETGWVEDAAAEVPRLSPRRRTVLNLVLEGMPRKMIASQLGISENTLGGYVKDIFRHFDVHSQAELIARFRRGDGHDTPGSGD